MIADSVQLYRFNIRIKNLVLRKRGDAQKQAGKNYQDLFHQFKNKVFNNDGLFLNVRRYMSNVKIFYKLLALMFDLIRFTTQSKDEQIGKRV